MNLKKSVNLNFKTKILLYFTSALLIGFIIIDIVSFFYIKDFIDNNLKKDVQIYKHIYLKEDKSKLISYLSVKKNIKENDEVVGKIDNNLYIVLNREKLYQNLTHYLIVIILWEVFTMFIILFLANAVVERSIRKENEIKEALEVFILAFTHKIKNFLGIQKVNLEILKINFNKKALLRLDKAYSLMEKDIEILIQVLKTLRDFKENKEEINLKECIYNIIKELESINPEKTILVQIDDIKVKADRRDIKNIFFAILENAFKYSEKKIVITDYKEDNYIVLKIFNDISFQDKGTGVGLELAKFLARKYKWEIKNITNEEGYTVLIKIPKN